MLIMDNNNDIIKYAYFKFLLRNIMNKITILLLLTIILFTFTSCGNNDTETELSEQIAMSEMFSSQKSVMKEIDSCQSNVYLELTLKLDGEDENLISIVANTKSNTDYINQLLSSVINTTVVMSGSKKEIEQRIMVIDNYIYLKNNTSDIWSKESLDEISLINLWEEQRSQIAGFEDVVSATNDECIYIGREKINGHMCSVYKNTIDSDNISQMNLGINNQLQGFEDILPETLENMIIEAEFKWYIDEETYYLREFRFEAELREEVDGTFINGTIKLYNRQDAFDEKISVEAPVINN